MSVRRQVHLNPERALVLTLVVHGAAFGDPKSSTHPLEVRQRAVRSVLQQVGASREAVLLQIVVSMRGGVRRVREPLSQLRFPPHSRQVDEALCQIAEGADGDVRPVRHGKVPHCDGFDHSYLFHG
jgi:hypothetical protein